MGRKNGERVTRNFAYKNDQKMKNNKQNKNSIMNSQDENNRKNDNEPVSSAWLKVKA